MLRIVYILFNRIKFKFKKVCYGKNLRVYNHIYLRKSSQSTFCIGDNLTFTSGDGINPISSNINGMIRLDDSASLTIGDNCGFSSTVLWVKDSITIGNNVLVGGGSLIMDCDRHNLDFRIRNGLIRGEKGEKIDTQTAKKAPVIIEDDVLIGARVIILKGVKIGARSVIGAGSVVTKDIPNDVIAGGNPCKIIQYRECLQ